MKDLEKIVQENRGPGDEVRRVMASIKSLRIFEERKLRAANLLGQHRQAQKDEMAARMAQDLCRKELARDLGEDDADALLRVLEYFVRTGHE